MPNKYYINDTTTPTIDLRSQIQKELRSLERKCNIRVANKETRFSDLKDNKNFYEHVEEEYEGALLLVFQKMKIRNYKEYKLLLGMFYHDFCLINNNEENDFYDEENIYVYDGKSFNFDSPFFKKPYKKIDESIYEKYSLRSWLKEMKM